MAVSVYNDGFAMMVKSIARYCGFDLTENMVHRCRSIDALRVKNNTRKSTSSFKNRRKEIRRLKHQRVASFQRVESIEYRSSHFHQSNGADRNKGTKRKQRKNCAKCGRADHQRSNSKLCPKNKKAVGGPIGGEELTGETISETYKIYADK